MNLTLDELQYLHSRLCISCPSDGIMHKRIEDKIAREIEQRERDIAYDVATDHMETVESQETYPIKHIQY